MTQQGFEDFIYAVYSNKSGAAKSYITAIHIIDQMFEYDDHFGLNGQSITCIDDSILLAQVAEYIRIQLSLRKKGKDSIFRNLNPKQLSYPDKGFCSAALTQLLKYSKYDAEEKEADLLIAKLPKKTSGAKVSNQLIKFFSIDKEGKDKLVESRMRIGQSYFRKMILANYGGRCCVTGLDVPQTLRASHIVAWAEDKRHRMNPENGLCLSATYDAAFDKHLISFDEDYRMIVSKEIKEYYTNEVTKEYFERFEGKQIIFPVKFLPNQHLLSRHRELLVV